MATFPNREAEVAALAADGIPHSLRELVLINQSRIGTIKDETRVGPSSGERSSILVKTHF